MNQQKFLTLRTVQIKRKFLAQSVGQRPNSISHGRRLALAHTPVVGQTTKWHRKSAKGSILLAPRTPPRENAGNSIQTSIANIVPREPERSQSGISFGTQCVTHGRDPGA